MQGRGVSIITPRLRSQINHYWFSNIPNAPVAQLDRALPSGGKGHRFESYRVRHFYQVETSSH